MSVSKIRITKGLHLIEGHNYAIEWVDSGRDFNGASVLPSNATLCNCVTFGKLLRFDIDNSILCIGTTVCDDDSSFDNTEYVAIDVNSIVSVERLVVSKKMKP